VVAEDDMSTIKIRSKHLANYTLVRTLIAHPMETGKRKDDDSGELVPAHFIQTLNFKYNDQLMSQCQMGVGIAKNPSSRISARYSVITRWILVVS
jgi:sulfur-oxidizing protein SoxZ